MQPSGPGRRRDKAECKNSETQASLRDVERIGPRDVVPPVHSHALETLQTEAHLHVLFLFSARDTFLPASSLIRPSR